jgi:uncharacterized protein (TIGR03000 family)
MIRTISALLALSSVASAQGIVSPYVPPPFIPVPAAVPGTVTGFNGVSANSRFGGLRIGAYSSFMSPYGYGNGYGYGYSPYYYGTSNLTYFGNGYGYGFPSNPLQSPIPVQPLPPPLPDLVPASTLDKDIAGAEFNARLELILPAPAELWMDGDRMMDSSSTEITLTSPPLKVGVSHTFKIRAMWSAEGKKYQVERSVTVKAGERSRLTIVSGDVVK